MPTTQDTNISEDYDKTPVRARIYQIKRVKYFNSLSLGQNAEKRESEYQRVSP
jgi:hypothetical protein